MHMFRDSWQASVSSVALARLGAIEVVRQLDVSGSEDLLHTLTADSDLEVRRQALSVLNEHLWHTLAALPYPAHLLSSLSRRRLPRNPVRDDLQVLVPTDEDLTAFGASDGSLLWASRGGQEAQDAVAQTAQGFLIQRSGYRLELRNLANGEVRSVWPQIDGVMRLAVEGPNAAVADMD
jgi:hypothetical protein